MGRILGWEFKGLFKSGKFRGILIFMVLMGIAYVPMGISDGIESGFDGLLGSLGFVTSSLYLVGSIYTGMYIGSAFQDRLMQSAIMAGNSRFKVLIGKSIGYFAALAIFIFLPTLIATIIFTIILGIGTGMTDSVFMDMFKMVALALLTNIASMSICIPLSFCTKSVGLSIGINTAVILLWYGLTQSFIADPKALNLLSYTTMGQSFLIYGELSGGDILKAILVSLVMISISIFIAYIIFSKEELK